LLIAYVDDFADRFGLPVEITCDPRLPWLTARTQAEVVRIVQEALNNVRRHADATLVRVRLTAEDERLVVVVADNGCGFDPGAIGKDDYGLASMNERAQLIGAQLKIDSRLRDGTRVRLELPLAVAAVAGTGLPT
jgi:signal transduction histidine kinase